MKPAEMFGVVVRTIGLLMTLGALSSFFVATMNLVLGGPGFLGGFLYGIPGMFLGLYFLSGAELLVNAVYPRAPGVRTDERASE